MLSFDLGTLAANAARVDDLLAPDDDVWVEGDAAPGEPLHITGRLSAAGQGRFYFSGHVEGRARGACRRCLDDVAVAVKDDAHFVFAEVGDEEADDPDVFRFDPRTRTLDLRPALREHWLLTTPAYLLCRDDCKGLCPRCGANLNEGPCGCAQAVDHRWDALRSIGDARR
jgi:DUF177 domain-containing protein